MLRLALGLLLLVACTGSSNATFDDRYFDSRGGIAQKKFVKHRAQRRHTRHHRHIRKAPRTAPRITTPEHNHFAVAGGVAPPSPHRAKHRYLSTRIATNSSAVIGGRPAGCPRQFCGCGASLEVFGRIIPALNLAANWLRFPRAVPAPGMVAARRGHVFVLKQHVSGPLWLVHDSNSGRHLTRLHPRSISGYAVVNPRGGAG